MSTRSDEREFWQPRYLTGDTPWDFGGVPIALAQWLRSQPSAGRVLIPGCGTGHEVQAFHDAGWKVVAVDYAPAAVSRARMILGDLGGKVLLADFFTDGFGGEFDVIYERTFLCSMPRDRWPAYVNRIAELLAEGGRLVFQEYDTGVFFNVPLGNWRKYSAQQREARRRGSRVLMPPRPDGK